ncbi:MAG: UDP-3-O-(3-hydroxymyristoyl)glucosamine N-acyltransferase [Deltaproteobacteria bacterium]|nr:UDP-3-O-(3-hydroxymyristoyl)glucosamine N-acyltransferase [Deltaproteobacteria bacterium]MBI3293805.1 UDP-3-O-(3-hydroxymyristoyl)glucosamine N-acyltransferase [Deltaproteobacteria bacterium]
MAFELPLTAQEIGKRIGAAVTGRPDRIVSSLAPLSEASPNTLSFFADRTYANRIKGLKDAVVLTKPDLVEAHPEVTFLAVVEPRSAFFGLLAEINPPPVGNGLVSTLAQVDPAARIGAGATIEEGAIVSAGATIGAGTILRARALIGAGVSIGRDCEIFSNVVIRDHVTIGDRVRILPGTVIGSEGFGFFQNGELPVAIPQLGTVTIGDDVRIGANCTIDRATMGVTRIGRFTKIDNLVHIAHNCVIGENCVLCAQVGLGGSTILEDNVVLGGQVGLGDHVTVGRGARMGGQSGSSTNVPGSETYFLTPALPMKEVFRVVKAMRRLPDLFARVRRLEGKGAEHDN